MKILISIVLCIAIAGCAIKHPVIERHNTLPMLIDAIASAEINYSKNNNEIILYCKDDKKCLNTLQRLNKTEMDNAINVAYQSIN